MPYDDDLNLLTDDQPTAQPANDNEAQLKRLGLILGSRLKAMPPRAPAPRAVSAEAPNFGTPPFLERPGGDPSTLGGAQPRPTRPPGPPDRSDFPAKPELGGWKKYLGLGLSALAGPGAAGPLAEKILHGQRDAAERQYGQATQDWERGQSDEERAARIENIRSEARARDNKPDKEVKPEAEAFSDLIKQGKTPREAYEIIKSAGKEDKTPSFEEQTYQEWLPTHPGGTRMQFEKDRSTATQKPERPEKPQRMMGVTPDGKVVEITPGMTLPSGTKSLGGELTLTAKTEQGEEAGKAATAYANDYLTGKQWTGPGDEALMEKFFELAKPSSGFRMTQAQIEMLQRSRDWMGSITAKAKHAFTPEAPWFSDTQRSQIVKTMNDLAKSREDVKPGGAKGGPLQVTDPNGGVHTFRDQASADRFKKLAGIK